MTWVDNDLTKLAGGTPTNPVGGLAAGIDGYSRGDGSQHVNFIDAAGHVHELYKSPDPAVQWVDNDLTKLARGTQATDGSALLGYSQGDGSQYVNFIDATGHVHELYRSPGPAVQWVDNDLTKLAGGPPGSTQAVPLYLAGYSQRDGSQIINYLESADPGAVHELYRSPDPARRQAARETAPAPSEARGPAGPPTRTRTARPPGKPRRGGATGGDRRRSDARPRRREPRRQRPGAGRADGAATGRHEREPGHAARPGPATGPPVPQLRGRHARGRAPPPPREGPDGEQTREDPAPSSRAARTGHRDRNPRQTPRPRRKATSRPAGAAPPRQGTEDKGGGRRARRAANAPRGRRRTGPGRAPSTPPVTGKDGEEVSET